MRMLFQVTHFSRIQREKNFCSCFDELHLLIVVVLCYYFVVLRLMFFFIVCSLIL